MSLEDHDVALVRAENPGPFTLEGTNSWLVGRAPAWLVDPGPDLPAHREGLEAEIGRRGGLGGIVLTHDHPDHAELAPSLAAEHRVPLAGARGAEVLLDDGDRFGPLRALRTPGHSPDHLALIAGPVGFSGDAVLGRGSVFVAPDPGALRGYLEGLRRLREEPLELLCPGHGPVVSDPGARIDEYLAHRLERERRLLEALRDGRRSVEELLDAAWSEVPEVLRPAAAVTLAAHLDKLEEEGVLPAGVQRPAVQI